MKYSLLFFFFCFSLISLSIKGQDTILLQGDVKQVNSNGKESYFYTKDDLPIDKVLQEKFISRDKIDLDYINGWIWVKFIIKNNSDTDEFFVLHTTSGHISGLYMYKPSSSGYTMTPAKAHHPEDGREFHNRLPAFVLNLKKGETKAFYLKINTQNEVVKFTYIIRNYTHYSEYIQADYMIIGVYFGSLLIIIVVNIFYYVSLKDRLFLVYAFYAFGSFVFTATLDGFTWLLIPNPNAAYHVSYFCLRFWTDALLFFTLQLVNLKLYHKTMAKAVYLFIFYHAVIMPILEFTNTFNIRIDKNSQWETTNCIIGIISVFIIIMISYKNNKYLLKYYFVAFSVLLITVIFIPLYAFGGAENYLLIQHGVKSGTLIEMLTLSFAVSRRFRLTENDLKRKKEEEQQLTNKVNQLEMDVRKAQMNPHFMFNALVSIEYFIFKNDSKKARNYLNKFAQLMRLTLDNSRNNYIRLQDELDALRFYLELEFLRLKAHPHNFEIRLDKKVNPNSILVPSLLIQPFVENAIWHGLQKKETAGKLIVDLAFHENELLCTIEDDGGGMEKMKTPANRKSSGILITKERLTLIHSLLKTENKFQIDNVKNQSGHVVGTCVKFNMPYMME